MIVIICCSENYPSPVLLKLGREDMSILNLALQTVTIYRSTCTMSADMERILKSLSTMAAIIRKTAQGNDSFKDELMPDGHFSRC